MYLLQGLAASMERITKNEDSILNLKIRNIF